MRLINCVEINLVEYSISFLITIVPIDFKIELFFQNTNPNIEIDFENQMQAIDIREARKHNKSIESVNFSEIASKMLADIGDDIDSDNLSSGNSKTSESPPEIISVYDYELANPVLQELKIFLKTNLPPTDIERLNKLDEKLNIGGRLHAELAKRMKSGKPFVNLKKLRDLDSKRVPNLLKLEIQNRINSGVPITTLNKLNSFDIKTTSSSLLLRDIKKTKVNFADLEKLDALDNKKVHNALHQELQSKINTGSAIVDLNKITCFDNKPLIITEEDRANLYKIDKKSNLLNNIAEPNISNNIVPFVENEINFENCSAFKSILEEEIKIFKRSVEKRMEAEYMRLKTELNDEKLNIEINSRKQKIEYSNKLSNNFDEIMKLSLDSALKAASNINTYN